MPGSTRPRRRSPAVSVNRKGWPSRSRCVSTGSRVVPGTSLTRARSSPKYGVHQASICRRWAARPRPPGSWRFPSGPPPAPAGDAGRPPAGHPPRCRVLRKRGTACPCRAGKSPPAEGSDVGESILLTTQNVGLSTPWSASTISRSTGVSPARPSMITSRISAAARAVCDCRRMSPSMPSSDGGVETAGIDQLKATTLVRALGINPVTGNTRPVVHDSVPGPQNPVEQGGFADIRPPDHGHQRHTRWPQSWQKLLPARPR